MDFQAQQAESRLIDVAPFAHPQPQKAYGMLRRCLYNTKILVLSCTLLPLRLVIVGTCLGAVSAVSYLLKNFLYHDLKNGEPISGFPRTILKYTLKYACRIGLFCCGFYNIRTVGHVEDQAHCLVSNHLSYVDIFLHLSQCTPSFVAKASVEKAPIIGSISEVLQCIYTSHERSSVVSTTPGTQQIIDRQRDQYEKQKKFPKLLVFPEGTTTNNKFLIHFRKGAFVGGFPVQPVVLKYSYSNFCPTWETIPPHFHFFRMLTEFYHLVEIHYLPTYHPNSEEKANPQLYADNVQKLMAECIGVPATHHTIKDKLAYHKEVIAGHYKWNEPVSTIELEAKEEESLIERQPGRKNS